MNSNHTGQYEYHVEDLDPLTVKNFAIESTPEKIMRAKVLAQTKSEISNLLELSVQIGQVTPLIYEGENVIEHLQRIDEFFMQLEDDLTEVKNYMVALLEFVYENQLPEIR